MVFNGLIGKFFDGHPERWTPEVMGDHGDWHECTKMSVSGAIARFYGESYRATEQYLLTNTGLKDTDDFQTFEEMIETIKRLGL